MFYKKDDTFVQNISSNGVSKKDSKLFRKIVSSSTFSLCPRGFGPTSFRLYESLQLNSIPIYVSDEFVLPYSDKIEWEKLCLLINLDEIHTIEERVDGLINSGEYRNFIEYGSYCYEEFFNFDFVINNIINVVKKF